MKANDKTIGEEVVGRLQRFAEKLETIDSVSELPKVITVRKVKLNLSPKVYSADELKEIRRRLGVSQAVFAEFLGVSVGSLRDWEQGRSEVQGPVCRIIEAMYRDTEAWRAQLRETASVTNE